MTLLEEIAQLLEDLGLGTLDAATGADIFLGELRDKPDLALAVARYPGGPSDAKLGYDSVNFQVRVRGPKTDSRIAEQKAQDVYDRMVGLRNRTLPGGTWLCLCIGLQSGPVWIGKDANDRHEWTVNLGTELRRQTANRT